MSWIEETAESMYPDSDITYGVGAVREAYAYGARAALERAAVPADTVNSVEELDALPDDSVVLDDAGTVLRKWTEDAWYATSEAYEYLSRSIGLPATVLYRP